MRHVVAAVLFVAIAAPSTPAVASEAQVRELWRELRFDDYSLVLVEEGVASGKDLAATLFPGGASDGWEKVVRALYDVDAMRATIARELHHRLDAYDMGEAVAFFQGETGARSVGLEISARRALLDSEVEAASKARMEEMDAAGDPRIDLVQKFSDVNALVENNVTSALNGNYAFLKALSAAGQGPYVGDPSGMLNAVWQQEAQVRDDTEQWVLSFFTFAYSPLSDAEFQELIDFSATEQGQRLNRALFDAFDAYYDDISAKLGTAAAHFMTGERL